MKRWAKRRVRSGCATSLRTPPDHGSSGHSLSSYWRSRYMPDLPTRSLVVSSGSLSTAARDVESDACFRAHPLPLPIALAARFYSR